MHFIEGKGTALIKPEDLVLKIVGHAMAVEHRDTIRTVCGDEKFMGVSAGCEIVANLKLISRLLLVKLIVAMHSTKYPRPPFWTLLLIKHRCTFLMPTAYLMRHLREPFSTITMPT